MERAYILCLVDKFFSLVELFWEVQNNGVINHGRCSRGVFRHWKMKPLMTCTNSWWNKASIETPYIWEIYKEKQTYMRIYTKVSSLVWFNASTTCTQLMKNWVFIKYTIHFYSLLRQLSKFFSSIDVIHCCDWPYNIFYIYINFNEL